MLFISFVTYSLLFASAVLAGLLRERHSRLLNRVKKSISARSDGVEYTGNWAGAVWEKDKDTFIVVNGTFTIPVPSGQIGSSASVWVGLDGSTCTSGLLQAGVDLNVNENGASFNAWYEWFPDQSYHFNLPISAGDVVGMTVVAYTATSGVAFVENLTQGQYDTVTLISTNALCGQDAEWIVEDTSGDDQFLFANFGTVTFIDGMALGSNGNVFTPEGATVNVIRQNGQTLTDVSIDGSEVTVTYV